MDKDEQTRLDDLEIMVAHQAQMLDDLNDAAVEQNKIIADLRRKMEALVHRLGELESDTGSAPANQKPPHW